MHFAARKEVELFTAQATGAACAPHTILQQHLHFVDALATEPPLVVPHARRRCRWRRHCRLAAKPSIENTRKLEKCYLHETGRNIRCETLGGTPFDAMHI